MGKLYCKWVSDNLTTMNDTKWQVGVPNELPQKANLKLCYPGLFHYSPHPLIAVMLKHFHVCNHYTKLYEVEPEGEIFEDWNLLGSTKLTLVKELEVPEVTLNQKIAFGILCALEVCKQKDFVTWANKWLNNEDRSEEPALNICDVLRTQFDEWSIKGVLLSIHYSIHPSASGLLLAFIGGNCLMANPSIDFVEVAHKAMFIS